MNPIFILTPAAVTHIRHQMDKDPGACGFYLTVKKTGCSGYAFKPEVIRAVPEGALHWVTPEGLPVYLAKDAMSFALGVCVDLSSDSTALKQKKLVFINPNETGRCGCGESFTVE